MMQQQMQQHAVTNSRNRITLRGSTRIIVEFFEYCINSLLFQRGLYAPEHFKMTKKYGLNMLVTTDPQVKAHMREILRQVEAWLLECKVEKLIMAIKSKETMTVLERWQFDIHNTKDEQAVLDANMLSTGSLGSFSPPSTDSIPGEGSQTQTQTDAVRIPGSMTSALSLSLSHRQQQPKPEKTEKEIQSEIQAILRQITASVSFLPMLDEKCTWTILCQTERDVEVPATWSDADPHLVHNAEQVRLRSFSTNLHRVDAMVAYRLQDEL